MWSVAPECRTGLHVCEEPHADASAARIGHQDVEYDQRKNRLQGTVYTLAKLVNPAGTNQFDQDLYDHFAGSMEQGEVAEFGQLMEKMSADAGRHLNVSTWLEGLEYSANKVGFLFSNDLVSSAMVLKAESGGFSRAEVQDRVRELILFAISPEYFALRKALGLAITV